MPWIAALLILAAIATWWFARKLKAMNAGSSNNPDSKLLWPVPGHTRISSAWGSRTHPITGVVKHHNGIDIPAPTGTPIVAPADGKVISITSSPTGGKMMIVQHSDGSRTGYAHLHQYLVNVGDSVERGRTIAQVGNTGASTGPHLHFTFRPPGASATVDPTPYLA